MFVSFKDLKNSNLVEIAAYVTARTAVQSKVKKSTYKYGIEVPTSTKHVLEIDCCNGSTL